jgi:hypothetical protein
MKIVARGVLLVAVCAPALLIAGCGGGGGGARPEPIRPPDPVPPGPVPAPTPTPAPTPSPGPTGFNTLEYRRSPAGEVNAIAAYEAGATGRGVKIGIIDSGLNPSLPEFAGRIDPASQNIRGGGPVSASDLHGTAVTAVAAATRNDALIHGVAFDATIVALNSADPSDCPNGRCLHNDNDIARGVDIARTAGARVINISLGGSAPSSELVSALQRATSAGIVVVYSAGNDGEADPDPLPLQSIRQVPSRLIVIAGAYGTAAGDIASFSNQAGTGATQFLLAPGDNIESFDETGRSFRFDGTSFSAPVISGAVALIASAFPNMSGQQIVDLLYRTATDLGQPGVDSIYGNGLINLPAAFRPQGQASLAGTATPVPIGEDSIASAAMGDAKVGGSLGAIILDGYSRAFAVDFAARMNRAAQERPLAQALHGVQRTAGLSAGPASVMLTISRDTVGQPQVGLAQTGLSRDDARQARATAGHALAQLSPTTKLAFGFAESGRALQQRLQGAEGRAFLVAQDPLTRSGFHARSGTSIGVRHNLGALALTVTQESGEVSDLRALRPFNLPNYEMAAITADRRFGSLSLSLGASRLAEEETVLGGRFGAAFASRGSKSWFADASVGLELGDGWSAAASYRRGWTALATSGALVDRGRLGSEAWSVDLGRNSAFRDGDRLSFRAMQPLRVVSGGFDLTLPTSYSYADGSVGYEGRFLSLSPTGRELDLEAAYSVGIAGGWLGLNAFLRSEPGHIAVAEDDVGAALRFSLGF